MKKEKITHYIRYLDVVKKAADLLKSVRAIVLAVFVDLDVHVWNANRLKTEWSSA